MTEQISGGQLVAESLVERGVETIFTLSGGHITPIYQYLETLPIKLFDTRHEQAAVFMAEAWGKMTRKAGVAMVTAGPGFKLIRPCFFVEEIYRKCPCESRKKVAQYMVVLCLLWIFSPGSLVLNSRAWKGIAFRKAMLLDLACI